MIDKNRLRVKLIFRRQLACGNKLILLIVELRVPQRSFGRLAIMSEHAFDPFVIEQPRAIHELVQHPCRQIIGYVRRSDHGSANDE
jgi:hypothetical protein